ncbi:uncharacterized protein [Eurosta solidaginis]|uniref:uncharacterized protein n=1 Tax=Eurosta solidaginis TaxID=178769 RepID=UPI003530A345
MLTTICLWCFFLYTTTTAAPNPQNFFNEAAVSDLGVENQVAELFQNGVAARRDFAFQMPGFGMHSKSKVDMGDEDSDEEERRRRRSIESEEYAASGPKTSFKNLLRNMHAPCHSGGSNSGSTDAGGEEIVEEARRRMARLKARKAAKAKKAKKTKSKKSNGRRKRQTEYDDLAEFNESEMTQWREKLREHFQQFSEKINRFYEHISAAMMETMKRVGEKFAGEN